MRRKPQGAFIALLFTSVVAVACGGGGGQDRLSENMRRWAEAGVGSYRYTLFIDCFCPDAFRGPVIVEVLNGVTTSVRFANASIQADRQYYGRYDSIEKMFGVIQRAVRDGADDLEVSYDKGYGFPTEISIDFDEQAVDDEISFTVSDFQAME